jgi:hypothetical protein
MRPRRTKHKRLEIGEAAYVADEDEYQMDHHLLSEARRLRSLNRFTLREIADKIGVNLAVLVHDFDLHDREIRSMDE